MVKVPPVVIKRIHEIEAQWPDALTTIYGPDKRIIYASANHRESGWAQSDMIGSHWTKFVPESDYQHGELALEDALLNDESTEIGVTGLTKYGEQLRMRVKGWRITDPDTNEVYILVRSLLVDKPTIQPD